MDLSERLLRLYFPFGSVAGRGHKKKLSDFHKTEFCSGLENGKIGSSKVGATFGILHKIFGLFLNESI